MITTCSSSLVLAAALFSAADATKEGPLAAGLQPGQRPGPYSAHVAVGAQRGQLHCFICETADRPAVIVFARKPSDGLGKLARGIERAVRDNKAVDLRAWITFLADDQPACDPVVVKWGQVQALRNLPLGVFEDGGGPPAYRLHRAADVTVLVAVKQKVIHAFAFRAGELTDSKIAEVLRSLPPRP